MRNKSAFRRSGWGLADQIVSSLTNLTLTVLVAHAVSPADFGAFSIAFSTYVLAQGSARAVAAEPLLILYSRLPKLDFTAKAREASGAALGIGVLVGLGCLAASALSRGALSQAFLGLSIVMPGLLLQDAWRHTLVAAKRPEKALVNDVVWGATLVTIIPLLFVWQAADLMPLIIAWGGTATLAAVVGAYQVGTAPAFGSLARWWREHRKLSFPYLFEFASATGAVQLTIYAVAFISGLAAAGSLRAAMVILGPINLVVMAFRLVAIPEGGQLLSDRPDTLRRSFRNISSALALVTLGWGIALSLIPDAVGELLLARTWDIAQPVIVPMSLSMSFAILILGSEMGLRVLAAARASWRARAITSVLLTILGITGAALGSAVGAALGMATGHAVGAAIYSHQFKRKMSDYMRSASSGG